MGQYQVKTYEQILERLISNVVARTDLTDINDGSSLKQVLSAFAREIDDLHFQHLNLLDLFDISKAIGEDLDERAKEFNPALTSRNQASRATGEVQFNRTSTSGTIAIPIGTQVKVPASGSQDEIVFTTTEEGTIANTQTTSNLVSVVADNAGSEGNVAVGTITGFVTKPSGVDTVTNPAALTNGADLESDDSFRDRLIRQIKGLARCHVEGLESAALTGEDATSGKRVVFAQVVEDLVNPGYVTLYIDDGAGSLNGDTVTLANKVLIASAAGGETSFTVDDGPLVPGTTFQLQIDTGSGYVTMAEGTDYTLHRPTGQITLLNTGTYPELTTGDAIRGTYTHYVGLVKEVQKIIEGDPGDRANYPGYRAAGVSVQVIPPDIDFQVVTINITVERGFNQTTLATAAKEAVSTYINSLGIGEDVILNEIRERVMAIPGMYDLELSAPTENQTINDGHLARVLSSQITVS